uniref:Reverse transcriptase domain-containing protein n=1 Tax=Anolis carolinensis TaxID=28377 RepID=A0A803T4B4_ANOCA
MNRALEEKQIPYSWKSANITVIPKEGADKTKVKNYRPISLLNTDYKIFTNILASRLKEILNEKIGQEQTGFLPGRHIKDNIRTILNIIEYYDKNIQKEVGLLFIDAEKAFDRVNWNFIIEVLKEMDVGYYFLNAIQAIYSHQFASIIINGNKTEEFSISKGTRQGCPLSPLIFILVLEILLTRIRKNNELKGLKIKNYSYKLCAFADDVACIIEDPANHWTRWWKELITFGEVAGLKINKEKTKMITKNISGKHKDELEKLTGIKIVRKVKYLGIEITASNAQLLKNNYEKKWTEIKEKMKRWSNLKLSLLGRIAVVKMNILPEVLYIFQTIPILRSRMIFTKWDKDIKKFIWENKKARIKISSLKDDRKRGGLGLPDLELYYEAAALTWVRDWVTLEKKRILALEGVELRRGWHSYLCKDKIKIEKNFKNHFIRAALIRIWDKYKFRFHTKTPMWFSPIEANHRRESSTDQWLTYKQLLTLNNQEIKLKTHEEIRKVDPNSSWLHYWQIREEYKEDKEKGFETTEKFWDKILKINTKLLRILYKQLLIWALEEEQIKEVMIKWARAVGHTIHLSQWEEIWGEKLRWAYATEIKENWYKMFHMWYLTPNKLARYSKGNINGNCWKCGKHSGTFLHMWWECKKIKKFWYEIYKKITKIVQKSLNSSQNVFY